jgi:proline dehydrogenase
MLRQSLLFLSESRSAQRMVLGMPVARGLAARFVAGESLESAIEAARAVNESGMTVSLDYLGESVHSRAEAEEAVQMAIHCLEAIAEHGIDGNISIKPTQLGVEIDEEFCRENVERVLRRAGELSEEEGEIFVRLDMESSEYTEQTIVLVERLWESGFRNVGTVLQSMLRRTPEDVDRLVSLGSRVRLVKGAYNEPARVAYPDKPDVDRKFIEEMQTLLEHGTFPAIATHDEAIIDATRRWAFEKGIHKHQFEFQMLYGIRRDLQARLREEGYLVRIYIPFGGSWYPYLMRRLAERPANMMFLASSVVRESPLRHVANPVAIAAGAAAGSLAALGWNRRRNDSRRG